MRSSAYTFLFENEFCLHLEWKTISTSKAERLTSFWYRGPGELVNGLLDPRHSDDT